jgi:EmrB/QacA subfamily drug resistance transporter
LEELVSTHVTHAGVPPHAAAEEERRPWTVLALMLAAQFMVVLDVSVVNVALPSIGESLRFGSGDYQWAVSAYVLFSGGLLLLGGRLADLFGRRRMFLTGLAVFTAASLLSGLSGSALMLVAARAAQGAGAAMLTPAAMSIVMTSYAGRQRATALGVWGTVASMGIAAGVLFGGVLTSALDWRAVFFVNVPIGAVTWAMTRRTVPVTRARGAAFGQLDLAGAGTAVAGLVALVYGIEQSSTRGWSSPVTLAAFAASALLLAGFAALERRVGNPLVPPHVWRVRSLVSASVVMAGVTGGVVGSIFLTSLFLQEVLGSSAVMAGLQFLPLAAAITLAAAVAGKLLPRVGPRGLIAGGLVIATAGALLLCTVDGGSGYLTGVLPGLVVLGAGVGPMFVAISVAAMSEVPPAFSGLASGLMMTGHEVGAAIGVAMVTAVGGDLTTRAGLVAGYPDACLAVAAVLVALLVPTALVPRHAATAHGHHGMH